MTASGLRCSRITNAAASAQFTQSQAGGAQFDASDFGAKGDGKNDDTAPLQAAMQAASMREVPLLIPPGDYVVTRSLLASSNLRILAKGATLQTYIAELGDSGRNVPTLMIDGVSNVSVVGLAVNGRKSAFQKTEYKAGICINNSSAIAIDDCDLYECKGDGLICFAHSEGDRNRFVSVTNTTCRDNYRLGCAINDLTVGRFVDCRFTGSLGTSPMAGLDIEPDSESAWISDIEFHRCRFSGNGSDRSDDGSGVTVNLHENPINTQEGISFYDCTIRKNKIMGVILYHGRDVGFHNCEITSNGKSGIAILETSDNIRVEGGTIARNQDEGITAIREPDQVLTNLLVRDVTIENNSRSSPRDFDGIKLAGSCHDISIVDNVVTGSHRYGVWIADTVTNVELSNNDLSGNGLGPAYPASLVEDSSGATPESLWALH